MLAVNEIYGPVKQGEGKSAGMDVMFLRLSGCNLACIWCFVGNTWISTPTGKKRIKDLNVGDLVLSSDGKIIVPKKITKVFKREVSKEDIVKVEVGSVKNDNNYVFCTRNHEFSTSRGWLAAENLTTSDEIEYIDSNQWYMKNRNPSCTDEGKIRISQLAKKTFTGKQASTEHRMRLRASKLGPKNSRYVGVRADSFKDYLTNWYRTRNDALKRDGYKCQNCGSTERLEVHHTIPFRISRSNDLSILITLCKFCHIQAERQFLHNGKKVRSVTEVTTKQAARFNNNSKTIEVYNFEVEDFHTYFANTLLVHNCDTPYTWNWKGTKFLHPNKFDPKVEVHKMTVAEVKKALYDNSKGVKALVISGGEPLLQQRELLDLIHELKKDDWWVEVETNGTIEPLPYFIHLIDQFNCSPKTSNAGIDNPLEKRINLQALWSIAHSGKGTFKFVTQKDLDMVEIKGILDVAGISEEQVWLMPEGKTKEEQLNRQSEVEIIARNNGYNFSPRLHILEFGDKRAV